MPIFCIKRWNFDSSRELEESSRNEPHPTSNLRDTTSVFRRTKFDKKVSRAIERDGNIKPHCSVKVYTNYTLFIIYTVQYIHYCVYSAYIHTHFTTYYMGPQRTLGHCGELEPILLFQVTFNNQYMNTMWTVDRFIGLFSVSKALNWYEDNPTLINNKVAKQSILARQHIDVL